MKSRRSACPPILQLDTLWQLGALTSPFGPSSESGVCSCHSGSSLVNPAMGSLKTTQAKVTTHPDAWMDSQASVLGQGTRSLTHMVPQMSNDKHCVLNCSLSVPECILAFLQSKSKEVCLQCPFCHQTLLEHGDDSIVVHPIFTRYH